MAGRFLKVFKVFRGKHNKDPGAALAQQPEEPEQFQPPQHNAAMDGTQDQKPKRGRFRRALKTVTKLMCIRRRRTSTTATEGPAEPESRPTDFQAKPDVGTDLTERSEDSNASVIDERAKADMAATEDVGKRDTETGEAQAMANMDTEESQGMANMYEMPSPTVIHAPSMDSLEKSAVPPEQQVPAIVKSIHQRLVSTLSMDPRLHINIVRLAEEHPADTVLTLLHCAPTCDRAATMIWRAIGSSNPTVGKVLTTLLCVMEDWPVHSILTSDGDNKDIFALAATLVFWLIVQVPECHEAMTLYSSRLFVTLLFHVVIMTQQKPPKEVDDFWRACQEEHHLPSNPNSFAVQAIKALLCRMSCENVVITVERKCGWDTLLPADTQHYAVGLLARVMRRVLTPLCSRIALHLVRMLGIEEPLWDLPFLAFLVEVLECLDLKKCRGSVHKIMSKHLQSNCSKRCRLALRGLVVLSKDPSMARRICTLSQHLVELLRDADGEVVGMTLRVFLNVLENERVLVSSTTAPKLAEELLVLFDHDNSRVKQLSIQLFCKVMERVVEEGKKPLKRIVNKSLYPLITYCNDKNKHVEKASWETLICVAKFLNRTDLEGMLRMEQPLNMEDYLLADDRRRMAEHLCQVLPELEALQKSLQEATINFIGATRQHLRREQGELQLIYKALQARRHDTSVSCSEVENQAQFDFEGAKESGRASGSSEAVSQEHTLHP